MRVIRAAVACVGLASLAAGLGFTGAWYFGVADAGDQPESTVEGAAATALATPVAGGAQRLVVTPTKRADIVIVSTPQPDNEALYRSILGYVLERNPSASVRAFREYPRVLLGEASRTNLDHCLALAQAQAESDFRPDAVGDAGEIGLYQLMPTTAAIFEPALGRFRKPSFRKIERDLGDLADPVTNTRFAMAYLRDILARKPTLREALTEYNGGPRGRQPHYYRIVMATYVEILERPELGCQVRERRPKAPRLELARR